MKEKKGNSPVSKVVEKSTTYDKKGDMTGKRLVERSFEYDDKASDTDILFFTLMWLLSGVGLGLLIGKI